MFEAILVALLVALSSVVGVLFFGHSALFHRLERFIVPVAVGVFLALALVELVPEAVAASPEWAGFVIGFGFVGFYLLAYLIHRRLHAVAEEWCEKREAALLLLTGDTIHNFADGIIIGGAFLVSPEVGVLTAVAITMHEVPQEIVEFGVLLRAGYTKLQALVRNFISASAVVVGTVFTMIFAGQLGEHVWVLAALAAGNLLYVAASELLPRLHGSHQLYGGFRNVFLSLCIGFVAMAALIHYAHESFDVHGHEHGAADYHHEAEPVVDTHGHDAVAGEHEEFLHIDEHELHTHEGMEPHAH